MDVDGVWVATGAAWRGNVLVVVDGLLTLRSPRWLGFSLFTLSTPARTCFCAALFIFFHSSCSSHSAASVTAFIGGLCSSLVGCNRAVPSPSCVGQTPLDILVRRFVTMPTAVLHIGLQWTRQLWHCDSYWQSGEDNVV